MPPSVDLLAGRRAVVFDAYGTLFDVHAAVARHAAAVGPDAARLSEIWRAKQLEYSWMLSLAGRYEPFWTLTERALDHAFARCPTVDRGLREALLDAYRTLDAFPDAAATLAGLRERGFRTGILSNGSPAMLASAVGSAGLGPLLDAVLSVDAARAPTPSSPRRSTAPRRRWCSSPRTAGTLPALPPSGFARCGSTGPACRRNMPSCRAPRSSPTSPAPSAFEAPARLSAAPQPGTQSPTALCSP